MRDGFPERLRALRKRKGLTQSELGQMADLHYQHIGRYERGSSQPSAAALKRLASALDVTLEHLVGGTTEQAPERKLQDPELLEQFHEAEQLPDEDKLVVKRLLAAFLTNRKIQALIAS